MNSQVAPDTQTPGPSASGSLRSPQRWPRLGGRRMWMLLALAAALVIYRMGVIEFSGISLFFDEAQYWDWSRHLQWGYYSKPPMIAALIKASTTVFGDSVLGVKVVSMLLYVATSVAIVGLARALWPTSSGVRTGIVAAALFLVSPMVGTLGMFASTDSPLILCWTLAAWALWRAQVTNRLSLWALLGVVCGLGLLSKYTMAAFAITAVWALWGVQGPRRGVFRLGPWVAVAVALALLSPNLLWNIQEGFPTLHHTAEITTQSSRSGGPKATLDFILGQVLMLGPLTVVAGLWLHRQIMRAPQAEVAGSTQWAASSQMMPPSQWAASTQMSTHLPSQLGTQPPSTLGPQKDARTRTVRTSALYLASVTAYRFLIMLSAPLLLLAVVQSFVAGAHINWAAPAMVGIFLLVASRLSQPLLPLAAPRPRKWFWAVLVGNLLMTGAVIHARDILGDNLPSKMDVLVRMRGWEQAFNTLESTLEDPRYKGLPVVADSRLMLTQSSYHWRKHSPKIMAWNPTGARDNHYQMQQSMPNVVGQDVLVLTESSNPQDILSRFAWVRELGRSAVAVGPDREVKLYLYLARGFVGYDNMTYKEQSGTDGVKTEDTPFTEQKK
ncbi:MAG: hypothetical protein RLZZ182_2092 [Pseudomonadota bacterium]